MVYSPAPVGGDMVTPGGEAGEVKGTMAGGRKVRGATVKQMKKMLKKAGLKTTGRKAALTRRAKKAHLKMKGGKVEEDGKKLEGARRSRRSRGKLGLLGL